MNLKESHEALANAQRQLRRARIALKLSVVAVVIGLASVILTWIAQL